MPNVLAALTLAAAPVPTPAPAPPALTPPQAAALRCGVVFAIGAKLQAEGRAPAAAWPPLAARGKEYFVRVTARLMDDTGASREALAALAAREAPALSDPKALGAAMANCLPLLDAAGL